MRIWKCFIFIFFDMFLGRFVVFSNVLLKRCDTDVSNLQGNTIYKLFGLTKLNE